MLQAKPGTESNLLTVTSDGSVYSYILKYSEKLPELNYFINENESIGSELPIKIKQKPEVKALNEYTNRDHQQKIKQRISTALTATIFDHLHLTLDAWVNSKPYSIYVLH